MRRVLNFAFIFLVSCSATSQTNKRDINLEGEVLVGEIVQNDAVKFTLDKELLINEINKAIFIGEKVITDVVIDSDYSIGGKKIQYFYLKFLSEGRPSLTVVKWLVFKDNKLYIGQSNNPEEFNYIDFYISCEGNENCKPRLFEDGESFSWSCREVRGCVTPEEAEKNKCKQTTSVL